MWNFDKKISTIKKMGGLKLICMKMYELILNIEGKSYYYYCKNNKGW